MFCVIYRFTVKPDHEAQFRRHNAGGRGSRLHRANADEYIGYAQWPDRQMWEQQ